MRIPFSIPKPGHHPFDVVGLGLNSLDLVTVVAEYPAANSKQRIERFLRLPGGQTATTLVSCVRLGWTAAYIGRFGGDDLGALSRQSLVDADVDLTWALTVPGATNQFAVVIVDARTGERTVLWDRHPGLTLEAGDVPVDGATAGRMLLVDCHETAAATQAARCARQVGIPTVVDVERVRPGMMELLREIYAIIAAEGFPSELTGYDAPGRALEALAQEFAAPLVCVTLGEGGSLARVGGREIRTPGFPVHCVDSTGAGDAFRGGFVSACLRAPDGEIEEVLAYANAVASLNCRAVGARGGLPTPAEVDAALRSRARL